MIHLPSASWSRRSRQLIMICLSTFTLRRSPQATDILLKYVEGWAFRRQTHSSLHGCVVSVKEPTCDKQFGYTSHHAVPEPARRGAG